MLWLLTCAVMHVQRRSLSFIVCLLSYSPLLYIILTRIISPQSLLKFVPVSPDSKTYSYTNLDSCFDTMDIAIHIAGEISDPFGEPGYLMENAVVAGTS